MPPDRFTVRLDDERAEWVAEQAEQRDASQAWVLRQAVDAARGADSVYAEGGADRTADRLDALDDRLARIEAAVANGGDGSGADRTGGGMEIGADRTGKAERSGADRTASGTDSGADRTDSTPSGGADRTGREKSGADRTASGTDSGADRTGDQVAARIDALVEQAASGWADDHRLDDRRAACRAALRRLYREGELSKATALDEIEPEHPVDGQNRESWWRQNIRDAVREVADYSRGHHTYQLDDDEPRPGAG